MVVASPSKAAAISPQWLKDCPWLGRLPAVNANDAKTPEDVAINRKAMLKTFFLLWMNPKHALANAAWLESRIENDAAPPAQSDTQFREHPATIAGIEQDWLVSYLTNSGLPWTDSLLAKAIKYDAEQVRHIYCNLLNLQPSTKMPVACSCKLTLKLASDIRRAEVGPRQVLPSGVKATELVDAAGQVDWSLIPTYKSKLDSSDRVVKVMHVPTNDWATCTSDIVASQWHMDHLWSDLRCVYQKTKTDKHKCCDYFSKGQGPYKHPTLCGDSKRWKDIVAEAVAKVEQNQTVGRTGVLASPGSALEDLRAEKKRDNAQKARVSLAKRAEERAVKRRRIIKGS